jgi:hypothetical protein
MDTVRGHKDLVLRRRSCIFVSSYHLSSATRFLHWETDVGLGACIRRLCWLLRNACALPDLYAHTWSITNSLLHSKMSRSQIMVPGHLIFLLERSMTSKVEDYGSERRLFGSLLNLTWPISRMRVLVGQA